MASSFHSLGNYLNSIPGSGVQTGRRDSCGGGNDILPNIAPLLPTVPVFWVLD